MTWTKGTVVVRSGGTTFLSVVFSWDVEKAVQQALEEMAAGQEVYVGGPAAYLNHKVFEASGITVARHLPMLHLHNPDATFTTRGCPNACPFCAVPRIEGRFVELQRFNIHPIVCDNNFLASSRHHFDRVIDALKGVVGVDFNQGLDARLLTDYHASRLAELKLARARLAWDDVNNAGVFMAAWEKLRKAGIPKSRIGCYVLIGFRDMPEDALYRLEMVKALGGMPNPMRYQPLDAKKKNEYVAEGWTHKELQRMVRYWSNLRITSKVPYKEFTH